MTRHLSFALALCLCLLSTASGRAQQTASSDTARLEFQVRGLPTGEFLDAFDPEQSVLEVSVHPKQQDPITQAMTIASIGSSLTLELPSDTPCQITLKIGLAYNTYLQNAFLCDLPSGEQQVVELDFKLDQMVRTQLKDIPCETHEGLYSMGIAADVQLKLPGSEARELKLPFRWAFDAEGRGYLPYSSEGSPEDSSFGSVADLARHHCFDLMRLERTEPKGETSLEQWTLAPKGRVVAIQARPGQVLRVASGRVQSPRNGFDSNGAHADVYFFNESSPELVTVFVDRQAAGSLRVADVLASEATCIAVDELPFLANEPNLQVTVTGVDTDLTPEKFWLRPADWTMYLTQRSDELRIRDTEPAFDSTGAIVANGKSARNMPTLAQWDQSDGSVRSATAALAPGEYYVDMWDRVHQITLFQSEPVSIQANSMTALQIDLDRMQRYRVVARHPDHGKPGLVSRNVSLLTGATSFGIVDHRETDFEEVPLPEEPYAMFLTSSAIPSEVMLLDAPGANGTMIPLRAAVPEDSAGSATLIAEVPRAYRVFTEFSAVDDGRVYGFSDVSRRDAEPPLFPILRRNYGPRTVQLYRDKGLGVIVRGAAATGVVKEIAADHNLLVRDWFHATSEGVELAGKGEGRWSSVVNHTGKPVVIAWAPADPEGRGFQPEFAGWLGREKKARLWIPASAQALRWYPATRQAHSHRDDNWKAAGLAHLGELDDLSVSVFELR